MYEAIYKLSRRHTPWQRKASRSGKSFLAHIPFSGNNTGKSHEVHMVLQDLMSSARFHRLLAAEVPDLPAYQAHHKALLSTMDPHKCLHNNEPDV